MAPESARTSRAVRLGKPVPRLYGDAALRGTTMGPASPTSARSRSTAADRKAAARQADGRTTSKNTQAKASIPGWQTQTLDRIRSLIKQAVPDVVEEVKWRKPSNAMQGVPVWSHEGIICTGETYKDKVKLTFMRGASLEDPAGLFNASLDGGTRRAIDIHEGEKLDEKAFKALIRSAAALNAGE
jgi:hypothetical protein